MKRLLLLLLLLAASSADAQLQISCGAQPCTYPGILTLAGDPAYNAFGKDNQNWNTLLIEGLFVSAGSSAPGILKTAYGGVISICSAGVPCNADTLWVNENISCSGSPAVITGMVDNLSLSPYGNGTAHATVTGCGPLSAQNVVQTGISVTTAGTGYVATVSPVGGDYIVVSGGTTVNGGTMTGSIVGATGVLTVSALGTAAQIYPGEVLTWSGSPNAVFIRDFISGKGNTGTYQTTYSGSDVASTTITGSNPTVIRVLTVLTGGVVTAGVVGGGQYSTAPGTCTGVGVVTCTGVAQGSTSGVGSGAQFTLSYGGLPISGRVTAVSWNGTTGGFTFASGTNSVNTLANTQEQVAIGHPDDASSTAALATNPVALVFPDTTQPAWSRIPLGYGFLNQINLPITQRISVLCQGARIIALGPLNAQMAVAWQSNTSLFYKPLMDNCDFQGMGVANYNLYESAAQWQIQNNSFENATVEPLFIGDANGDNANDVVVLGTRIHTDTNAVPAWPMYNYEINAAADNKVIGGTFDHAIWGGMLLNGADDQITATHVFAYAAGPCYDIESTKDGIDGICDNQGPGQAGYFINGSLDQIKDGWMDSVSSPTLLGRYGVYVNKDQHSTIGCGVGDSGAVWNGNTANLVFFGVAQVQTRVAPCTGNGTSDPNIYGNNLTLTGTATIPTLNVTTCSGCGNPVLVQSALPFIVTGGCSINGSGTLSGCGGTATMPNAQTHYAYMFFPATQLAASGNGSAAGFYAVQMTSASAGQVCSTAGTPATVVLYVSGYPVEPSACSTFAPNTTGTVTPTTAADLTTINLSLAGNSLGNNGSLEYDWVIATDGATGTHTSKVKFGSATFAGIAPTTATPGVGHWVFRNGGDSTVNTAFARANTGIASQNILASSDTYPNQGNAGAQTISFTLQLSNTTIANEFIILDSYSVKMYASNP